MHQFALEQENGLLLTILNYFLHRTLYYALLLLQKVFSPNDLRNKLLLRTYRQDEWYHWLEVAGVEPWVITGPILIHLDLWLMLLAYLME